jgi:hypothetical protein
MTAANIEADNAVSARPSFRDPSTLANIVRVLLYIQIVFIIVQIVSAWMQYDLLLDMQAGRYAGSQAMTAATANDLRQRILAYIWIGSYTLTAFFILKWIYRSARNVLQLGAKGLDVDPGWAVACYFIPVLSFFVPFAVMRKIWKASADPRAWQPQRSPYLIPLWWALFLIANFAGYFELLSGLGANSIDELLSASLVSAISSSVYIPLDLVFIRLMSKVTEMQVQQSQKLQGSTARMAHAFSPKEATSQSAMGRAASCQFASSMIACAPFFTINERTP